MAEEVITRDPEIMGGIPCFRGTRVPFRTLLDYLEGGETLDDFLEQFPGVTREMAIAALEARRNPYLPELHEDFAGRMRSAGSLQKLS